MLTVKVVKLNGEVVLESLIPATQSVLELKEAIARHGNRWDLPSWQHLIDGHELSDTEILGELYSTEVTLTLLVTADPWDLLLSQKPYSKDLQTKEANSRFQGRSRVYFWNQTEVCQKGPLSRMWPEQGAELRQPNAVGAFEAMPMEQSWALIERLFESPEVNEDVVWRPEDLLYFLHEDLKTEIKEKSILKAAIIPQVIRILDLPDPKRDFGKVICAVSWLGEMLVPHLVAWLGVRPRPLCSNLRPKVELLRQLCPSARVRLAATRALSDGGKVSTARVEELANLRGALLRDLRVEKLVPPLRKELEKWREEVTLTLRSCGNAASDTPAVRYALQRALRR